MLNAMGLAVSLLAAQATYTGSDIVQTKLTDISFTAKVVAGYQNELAKINKDFGNSYRVKSTFVRAKEPFKVLLESKVGDTDVKYIINGTRRLYSIPRAKLSQKENLADAPGKRQTFLDFGVVTPSMISELFVAKFVRSDRATGALVFDLTYPKKWDDTSRHRVWIDPSKRFVEKREWYGQSGRHMATFYHEKPVQFDGIWFASEVTVRNADNKVAGIMRYENVKVNTGLNDSLFVIK